MKITLPLLVLLLGAPCLAVPVSVSVVDDKGSPVVRADVQLQSFAKAPKGTVIVSSDAQGIAVFDIEPSKSQANFVGRIAVWKSEFALGGGNLVLQKPLKVVLHPSQEVSGTVVDEDKHPIAGATVRFKFYRAPGQSSTVYLFDGPLQERMQTVSGADGSWKLDHLPPDVSVGIAIRAKDRANADTQLPSGSSIQTALHPGSTIEGRLLGLDGQPLAGVRVYAQQINRDSPSRSFGEGVTAADGTFQMSGLEKGDYRVGFSPTDDSPFVVPTAQSVAVTPEKAVQLPDTRAVPGVLLSGQVVARDTKTPVAGVYIGLQSDDNPDTMSSTTTDDSGHWQIRTLEKTGKLYVQGTPPEFVRDEKQRIPVAAQHDTPAFNFELSRASRIIGRLVDESGHGVQTSSLVLRQNYEEYPVQSDEDGNFTAFGPKDGQFEVGRPRWSGGDEGEATKWDVVGTSKFSIPTTNPIEIKLKRAQISSLELGAFDQDDVGIEGVKVMVMLSTSNGQTGTSPPLPLVTDKSGRIHVAGIRSDETVSIQSATKEGYDLVTLPKIQQVNGVYQVDITLIQRRGEAKGQLLDAHGLGVAGARVYASGIEATSDDKGHFSLSPLPAEQTEIMAWKDNDFAIGTTEQTRLELKTQALAPTDVARAQNILNSVREESKGTQYYRRDSLTLDLSQGDFDTDAQRATASNSPGLFSLIQRYGGDASIAPEKWIALLQNLKSPSDRLYCVGVWTSFVASVTENDATRAWLLSLEADAQQVEKVGDATSRWQNALGLFGVAALAERLGQSGKADELFEHANAYVQRNFPEFGNENNPSQDDTFGVMGEMLAVSPRFLGKLLALVDTDSAAYSRLLRDGAPLIARLNGLDTSRPFLDLLKKAPQPNPDRRGNSASVEWALSQAVLDSVRAGGKSNPALALEMAQSLPKRPQLGNDDGRARAISEAAFSQPLLVAEGLWRDTLLQLESSMAMGYVVRIAQTNEPLARRLYELVRENLDAQPEDDPNAMVYGRARQLPAFAFLEAHFNPARARYRLEKAYQKALTDPNGRYELASYARTMALFDTERALLWANQLGNTDNNFAGFEAKRGIARWLALDEGARRKVNPGDRNPRDPDF